MDDQVHIGHNCEIGENTAIAGCVGIAGSTKIGSNCTLAGQVGVVGHIEVGDHVQIQGQSGVSSNIPSNMAIQGTPAFSYKDYSRSYIYFKKLPDIIKKIESLEKKHSQ